MTEIFKVGETLVFSFEALVSGLNSRCWMWGQEEKEKRLLRTGWSARQPEIDQLKQEILQLKKTEGGE